MEGAASTTASGKLAAHESVAAGGSTNDMAVPQWSNQTYLTLQLLRPRARLTL